LKTLSVLEGLNSFHEMERDVANIEGLYVEGIKLDRFCEASVVGLGLILIQVLGPAAV
jgi:hypothetical protein